MDWAAIGEVIKVLALVATAGAAWFAATVTYRGLSKWRAETIATRKAELAEKVLADFYRARDIINNARSPDDLGHEGATRQKAESESEDDSRLLNRYFATFEMLKKEQEFFAQLHARRYRFIAHFGPEAARPYNQLHESYVKIVKAAHLLLITFSFQDLEGLPAERDKWEITIGRGTDDDKIPGQLDAIVEAIEKICCPAIQDAAK
jgi:hypothetical protein